MSRKLVIEPHGWPCSLRSCPPGFFVFNDDLCFKSEYGVGSDIFCSSGEAFWGGTKTHEARGELMVQPVVARWKEQP